MPDYHSSHSAVKEQGNTQSSRRSALSLWNKALHAVGSELLIFAALKVGEADNSQILGVVRQANRFIHRY